MKIARRFVLPRDLAAARRLQERLRARIVLRGGPRPGAVPAVGEVRARDEPDPAGAAVALLALPGLEVVETAWAEGLPPFPYVPGFLAFREGPLLLEAFRRLRREPDLILLDGAGLAHPRGFGLACHIGYVLDRPTVGCAKSLLVGEVTAPGSRRGAWAPLRLGRRTVGAALRTRTGVHPIFVSPGHRIGLPAAVRWVLAATPRYRVPEPIRQAEQLVNRLRAL